MDKDSLLELTKRIYGQTLLFPKKEPLRYKIRETADDILAKALKEEEIGEDLEVMKSYLEIAKWQNWSSYFDIIKIIDEYERLKIKPRAEKEEVKKEEKFDPEIDERKKKIIKILKEKENVQVGDVKEILPNVSKRTLRRDFDVLIKKGVVERVGESNSTFYKLS